MTQPESRLQRKIQDEIRKRGGFVFKFHGSALTMRGVPDLIVCWRGLYVGLEVKMPGEKPSPIQRHRGRQIRAAGGCAYVVRSVDEALAALERAERYAQRPTQRERAQT